MVLLSCEPDAELIYLSVCFEKMENKLDKQDIDRIIEMAWEDRTPFDVIELQFGLPEKKVIELMRREMKATSFKMWRKRVQGRTTKHRLKSISNQLRFKSNSQKSISNNKIPKR